MSQQRLQKIIAQAGITSRRHAEKLIVDGRVSVNGRVQRKLGTTADPRSARVEIQGIGVLKAEAAAYLILHKPPFVVSTVDDPEGRDTVLDVIEGSRAQGPKQFEGEFPRLYPVGRLDFDAEGLVLMTNDGDLSQTLLHPRSHVPKTYVVKVKGKIDDRALQALADGVWMAPTVPDARAVRSAPAQVKRVSEGPSNSWIEITLFEGRNHQVKRMCRAVGFPCIRLVRTEFAGLALGALPTGAWRHITHAELAILKGWRGGE